MEAKHYTRDNVRAVLGYDPETIIEQVQETFRAYAKKRAFVEQLEHGRKIMIAECVEDERKTFQRSGDKVTEARLDQLARTSQKYRDFIKLIYKAKVELAELEAEHFSWRNRWEYGIEQIRFARSEMYLQER